MDVFLTAANVERRASPPVPRQARARRRQQNPQSTVPAALEKIIASGSVVITEPNRRGTGETLVYTTAGRQVRPHRRTA